MRKQICTCGSTKVRIVETDWAGDHGPAIEWQVMCCTCGAYADAALSKTEAWLNWSNTETHSHETKEDQH